MTLEHIETVKHPNAKEVMQTLSGVGVNYIVVGSPLFDFFQTGEYHYWDDIDLMVRDSELATALTGLATNGWEYAVDDDELQTSERPTAQHVADSLKNPRTPRMTLTNVAGWPADLWLSLETTKRHSELIMVDLDHWFGMVGSSIISVMDGTNITIPPAWALALYHSDLLCIDAANLEVSANTVWKLYSIVSLPTMNWTEFVNRANQYEDEQRTRRTRIKSMYDAYFTNAGHDPDTMWPLTEWFIWRSAKWALEAVEDYYPGTVPSWVLDTARTTGSGTGQRRIWAFDGTLKDRRYFRELAGTGIGGTTTHSIKEQIDGGYNNAYPPTSIFDSFATPLDTGIPADEEWGQCTQTDLDTLWAPLT